MISLIVFNGSDIAARVTGVRRSSDIEATNSLWNVLMVVKVSEGTESLPNVKSLSPNTLSQSCNVCQLANEHLQRIVVKENTMLCRQKLSDSLIKHLRLKKQEMYSKNAIFLPTKSYMRDYLINIKNAF